MIRLLVRTVIFLLAAAIGILVATSVLDDMHVTATGFVAAVVIYAVLQAVLSPFITKMAALYATALLGGTGLVATFVALLITSAVGDSLVINGGVATWVSATVIVWVITAVATLLIPWLLVKAGVEAARSRPARG